MLGQVGVGAGVLFPVLRSTTTSRPCVVELQPVDPALAARRPAVGVVELDQELLLDRDQPARVAASQPISLSTICLGAVPLPAGRASGRGSSICVEPVGHIRDELRPGSTAASLGEHRGGVHQVADRPARPTGGSLPPCRSSSQRRPHRSDALHRGRVTRTGSPSSTSGAVVGERAQPPPLVRVGARHPGRGQPGELRGGRAPRRSAGWSGSVDAVRSSATSAGRVSGAAAGPAARRSGPARASPARSGRRRSGSAAGQLARGTGSAAPRRRRRCVPGRPR